MGGESISYQVFDINHMRLNSTGLSFRGNDMESAETLNFDDEKNYFRSERKEGTFFGLVKLLAGENTALAEHLKKCEKHAQSGRRNNLTFLSKRFVQSVLSIIQNYMVQKIVKEIKEGGGFFGVQMDGSQDISCKEQISVVVRYVDQSKNIVERTILFFNPDDTSGRGLYESLRSALSNVGLNLCNVVGCSFDGATNMRSNIKGVQARIQEDNPNCIYTWCISHRFNLVIKSSTGRSGVIKVILHQAEGAAKLFKSSYTRANVWTAVAKSMPGFHPLRKLKLIGTTRWSSQQDAIDAIIGDKSNFCVLIKSLIKLSCLPTLDGATLELVNETLNFWLQFENIVSTYLLHKIFSLLVSTTKYLQNYGLNIVEAIKHLQVVVENLDFFIERMDLFLDEARQLVQNVNNILEKDSEMRFLTFECTVIIPAEEKISEIYSELKHEFCSFIEHLQDDIFEKILMEFNESDSIFHEMLFLDVKYAKGNVDYITLKKLCEVNNITTEKKAVEEMKTFLSVFADDSDLESDPNCVDNEIYSSDENNADLDTSDNLNVTEKRRNHVKSVRRKTCKCFQCILHYFNESDCRADYENIHKLYSYVAMLPSTQVKCERDFSKMKLIKSRLRSNMGAEKLESLMIISTECDLFENIDLEDLLDKIIASSDKISLYIGC